MSTILTNIYAFRKELRDTFKNPVLVVLEFADTKMVRRHRDRQNSANSWISTRRVHDGEKAQTRRTESRNKPSSQP